MNHVQIAPYFEKETIKCYFVRDLLPAIPGVAVLFILKSYPRIPFAVRSQLSYDAAM